MIVAIIPPKKVWIISPCLKEVKNICSKIEDGMNSLQRVSKYLNCFS